VAQGVGGFFLTALGRRKWENDAQDGAMMGKTTRPGKWFHGTGGVVARGPLRLRPEGRVGEGEIVNSGLNC